MYKKGLALLVATMMLAVMAMPAFASDMPFADVPKDHWAYDSVAELAAAGLVIGYPDGTFKGDRSFTRYEMAMVFARILGRLDTLISAEVASEVKSGVQGLSEKIYDEVAKALVEEMAKVKAQLQAEMKETVKSEVANIKVPEKTVVERVVVEKPIETTIEKTVEVTRPFELTDEAKAVIAKVVADMVAEKAAQFQPQVVEKIIEAKPSLTEKEVQELVAAATNAETTAELNADKIAELEELVAEARSLLDEMAPKMDEMGSALDDMGSAVDNMGHALDKMAFDMEVTDAVASVAEKKAGVAMSSADAAKKDAAAALKASEEAKTEASTATEQALAALKAAEAAKTTAEGAAGKAEEVAGAVQEAMGAAEKAAGVAERATETAEEATFKAEQAVGTAAEAVGMAGKAVDIAEKAAGTAEKAIATAEKAVDTATGAAAAADKAVVTAEGAVAKAEAAGAAAEEATATAKEAKATADQALQKVRNVAITIAALEGDTDKVKALLEESVQALEADIAALSEEFKNELASLGVRVSELENIIADLQPRVAALESDLDELKAKTEADIAGLRVADSVLQEDINEVAEAHAKTVEKVAAVDEAQKATAEEFAQFKAEHEKVKLYGSTKTVFENVGIEAGANAWVTNGNGDQGVYRDPRNTDFDGDGNDWTGDGDGDDVYQRTATLQQQFVLNLEATPAEGVTVKAGLVDTVDIFGDTDADGSFDDLSNITLEVTTDRALRSFFAGERSADDVAARYNKFILDADKVSDTEVVAANVVVGKLDTEIQLFRPSSDAPANYVGTLDAVYNLSDALVVDLEYMSAWADQNAVEEGMTNTKEGTAYSIGLSGDLGLADYAITYASDVDNDAAGYELSIGKAYGPEPAEDEEDTRPQWDITYTSVGAGYSVFLGGVDGDTSKLTLTADNYNLAGLVVGGGYEIEDDGAKETAFMVKAKKENLFGLPLTVSGEYASMDASTVSDGSHLLGKIAYEPTIGNLKLAASYETTNNLVDGDWNEPDAWKGGAENTTKASVEYPFAVWDTTITGLVAYENRRSADTNREYVDPLMTYKVSVERALGDGTVEASYQYRTGGSNNDPQTDKITEFKLTYPVIRDTADLTVAYRVVDVEAYDSDYDYKASEVKAGLEFEF